MAVTAAEQDGQIVAGAILSQSDGVVGVSNFFARPGARTGSWRGFPALAASLFPGQTLVGYESGPRLAYAERHGFKPIGRLRVWIKDT